MGDVVRFMNPKRDKFLDSATEATLQTFAASVSDANNDAFLEDITAVLCRFVYQVFYHMQDKGVAPNDICQEIDFFTDIMQEHLPLVKKSVWEHADE